MISKLILDHYNDNHLFIDIASAYNETGSSGKFSVKKILESALHTYKIITCTIIKKPDFIYYSFTPTGFARTRDYFINLVLRLIGSKKIIFHFHAEFEEEKKYTLLDSFIFSKSHAICLNPEQSCRLQSATSILKQNIHLIPNRIIDPDKASQISIQSLISHRLSRPQKKLLFLSNLMKGKGAEIAIKAFFTLKKRHPDIGLIIAGKTLDHDYRSLLHKLCLSSPEYAKDVEFFGEANEEAKDYLYRNSSAFLFTSKLPETFGLVNLEALSYALPIFSLKTPASHYFIKNGVNGYIVSDESDLAEKLDTVISSSSRLERMMRASAEKSREFYKDIFFSEIDNALERL